MEGGKRDETFFSAHILTNFETCRSPFKNETLHQERFRGLHNYLFPTSFCFVSTNSKSVLFFKFCTRHTFSVLLWSSIPWEICKPSARGAFKRGSTPRRDLCFALYTGEKIIPRPHRATYSPPAVGLGGLVLHRCGGGGIGHRYRATHGKTYFWIDNNSYTKVQNNSQSWILVWLFYWTKYMYRKKSKQMIEFFFCKSVLKYWRYTNMNYFLPYCLHQSWVRL
jgi:hypothetical protein